MFTDSVVASQLQTTLTSSSHGLSSGSAHRFAEAYGRFEQAYSQGIAKANGGAFSPTGENGPSPLFSPLMNLNSASTRLAERSGQAALADMKPSELMMLTMRSHEFLFNCQLVANVANRSSDGVQQLFRQQS